MPGQKSGPNIMKTNTIKTAKLKNKLIRKNKTDAFGGRSTIDNRQARRIEKDAKMEKRKAKWMAKKAAIKARAVGATALMSDSD